MSDDAKSLTRQSHVKAQLAAYDAGYAEGKRGLAYTGTTQIGLWGWRHAQKGLPR